MKYQIYFGISEREYLRAKLKGTNYCGKPVDNYVENFVDNQQFTIQGYEEGDINRFIQW